MRMLHSTPIPAVNGGVEEVPRKPAGSVSTAEQSAPTTSVPRICRVLGKQGALGLKARSGLIRAQTYNFFLSSFYKFFETRRVSCP